MNIKLIHHFAVMLSCCYEEIAQRGRSARLADTTHETEIKKVRPWVEKKKKHGRTDDALRPSRQYP